MRWALPGGHYRRSSCISINSSRKRVSTLDNTVCKLRRSEMARRRVLTIFNFVPKLINVCTSLVVMSMFACSIVVTLASCVK